MQDFAAELLTDNLPLIDSVISVTCRRARMSPADAEEFRGHVLLCLVENDYAILRAYEGRSTLSAYLSVVVTRLLLGYRNQRFGRWRPSAAAEKLGDAAVQLERLLYRDHQPTDEVFARVRALHPDLTEEDLLELATKIPSRPRRRDVHLEEAAHVQSNDAPTTERAQIAARISEKVHALIDNLSKEDQMILRLRFDADLTVPEIARALGAKPFQIYQRLDRRLRKLRSELETAGIRAGDAADVIGSDVAPLKFLDVDDEQPDEESVVMQS